jgi:hypothetical protein
VIGKGNKLAVLFSFILASSALLGELAHNHSYEVHDADHHEIEFQNECLSCTSDQVSNELELALFHLFFSDKIEIEHINSYQKKNQSFFLSRAPPQ